MHKCIQFDIQALEPLKLGKFERDSNNEYSYSYIPGSVVKGAVAWGLVEEKGFVPKEILNGSSIFYNAYPLLDGNPAIPMMQGYMGDKQEIRSNKDNVRVVHSFNRKIENSIPLNNYEFVVKDAENEKLLLGYNPGKIENLHINKKDALNDSSKLKMFRYEAIRKGECFRAYIRVPEEHYDDIVKILSKDYIYFGGSRGSGYGKCRVTGIKEVSAVCLYESDLDIKEDLYIYFLSDAILYYDGKVNTYIPENELKEMLGIEGKCEYVESYSGLGVAASYNTLYRTNTVCYTAVLKGSVIKYRVEGKINPDRIKKLASEGVGLRREDGYGQIAVLGKIQDDMVVSRYRKNDIVEKSDIELTDEDKRVVNMILCNIFKTRSKLQIEKMVIELLKDVNRPQESLQSQIGKLLNIFQNGFYQTEDDFRKYLNEYLEHIRKKKGKDVWHKLYDFTVANTLDKSSSERLSIQKMLEDFVQNKSNSVFREIENIVSKGITLGRCQYPVESQKAQVLYNLKMGFFISFFEYCLRLKEKEVIS
ncbi:MAG TPA: RAMP superfamily CRISPR-associated protein [Defluviitaleaceae bacterium]|nr:RAMP superfamily CRISPR-associated protein [Defluviitaleaceae bacterium]